MFAKILVPLDGSVMAEGILPYVQALARLEGAFVTLLHAVDLDALGERAPRRSDRMDEMVRSARANASAYLEALARRVPSATITFSAKVLAGTAAEQIVDDADQEGYDLIALSVYGRSDEGGWAFGGVADRVLQATRIPLLLVKRAPVTELVPPSRVALRRVVVPLDGSDLAEEAVPYAAYLAHRLSLEVHLVRVIHYQAETVFGMRSQDPYSPLEDDAEAYLAHVQHDLEREGLGVRSTLLWGYPAGPIVEAARTDPPSIVVISSHGRSGPSRWNLGATADRVVRAIPGPVLVVRPRVARRGGYRASGPEGEAVVPGRDLSRTRSHVAAGTR